MTENHKHRFVEGIGLTCDICSKENFQHDRRTFRAKNMNGTWLYGGLVRGTESAIVHFPTCRQMPEFTLVQPDTVGQCTGIRCCPSKVTYRATGHEPYVFEGDIVECMSQGYTGRFIVKWRDTGQPIWLLWPAWQNREFWSIHASKCNNFDKIPSDDITIIGNIHDNPEIKQEIEERSERVDSAKAAE